MSAGIAIRPYEESDLEAIVEFSLRAWQPVFESLRHVLGDAIFTRLHQPEWTAVQAEAVRSSCTTGERNVFVAVAVGRLWVLVPVSTAVIRTSPGVVDVSGRVPTGAALPSTAGAMVTPRSTSLTPTAAGLRR